MSGLSGQTELPPAGASRRRGLGWLAHFTLLAFSMGTALAAPQGLGFSRSVTPGLVARYAARFGPESRTRISDWQQFVRSVTAGQRPGPASDLELLGPVNTYFNRLPFVTDQAHWNVEDYWASPAEAVGSNGADCEDFSIAKYFALKELGVPIERLRITYVKAVRLDKAHMVLAYYPAPDAVPLVLDNLENKIRPASERTDLVPVYSFNDDDLLLLGEGQTSTRTRNTRQIRSWNTLLNKLEQELHY
jgi:predicted transglutaminase-like cysteine proteinase